MENTEEKLEDNVLMPNPLSMVPSALREVNALFIGPVADGFFQPTQDKLENPPRWEQGNYSLTAGKWPSQLPNLMDLTPYNGYALMVIAAAWDKEVISQARIVGVMSKMAGDVLSKFAYLTLQEKEEEIAGYTSGLSN
ncbi:hypothetical protein GCM10023188_30200 [Pontibacter saemangeumensis]|uniref:Uncharacterized protein n=1 Tax=Pontibacter saemangeumensis TaxID=1084525 RepID=A0ABP8LWX0_9BACT